MGLFNKNKKTKAKAETYHGSDEHLEQLEEARTRANQSETLERPRKQDVFLLCLRKTGNVSRACAAAGISRGTAYRWKANDEGAKEGEGDGFSSRWEEVVAAYVDELETEVDRRAFAGDNVPVIYQGEAMVDPKTQQPLTLKRYSDALASLRLKALRPDKYRERQETHHTGGTENTQRVIFTMPDNGRD